MDYYQWQAKMATETGVTVKLNGPVDVWQIATEVERAQWRRYSFGEVDSSDVELIIANKVIGQLAHQQLPASMDELHAAIRHAATEFTRDYLVLHARAA